MQKILVCALPRTVDAVVLVLDALDGAGDGALGANDEPPVLG